MDENMRIYEKDYGKKCYIYIRVSSERQIKGFSLDGQKHYLENKAKERGMEVASVFVEEGKSGKSIEGRTAFQTMMNKVVSGEDEVSYIMVYKLSRFGRNACDTLNSLNYIMKYGVHLLCIEDGLDSSKAMGVMMITILSAVAEMERENIIAQTLLGREEKAKSGGWNGGFAPYGYRLKKGKLVVDEEEGDIVRMIFDMFLHKGMGYSTIARYLNQHGYTRKPAPNAVNPKFDDWRSSQVKRILDHPVYTGWIVWGRRRTKEVKGADGIQQKLVPQDEYLFSEKQSHEALVSSEDFQRVQEKRIKMKEDARGNIKAGRERAHLLSGITRCPQCGSAMNVDCTQWTNKDGTKRERFAYVCSHYKQARGSNQCSRNGVSAEQVEKEVVEFTKRLVKNPKFAEDIKNKIGIAVDVSHLQDSLDKYEKKRKTLIKNKIHLENDIDSIVADSREEFKRKEYNRRLDKLYEKIYDIEECIKECKSNINLALEQAITVDGIYKILLSFDSIYDKMNSRERRNLIKCLVEKVDIFTAEERKETGYAVKRIVYAFPVEKEIIDSLRVNDTRVETVVSLARKPQ